MNDPVISNSPSKPAETTPTPSGGGDLQQEVAALRALVLKLQSSLLALTVIAGIYIGANYWISKQDLGAARQLVAATRQNEAAVSQFVSQLVEYGRTHPDFMNVLSKYPIQMPAAPAPAKPAPAAPAGAPKK